MKQSLQSVSTQASQLEPGPKAVLAGLLWQAGRHEEAITHARDIPMEKILREERWFLEPLKTR